MSRIYFHSEHGIAEVSGRERAHMGTFCSSLLIAALRLDRSWPSDAALYRALLPAEHYVQQGTDVQFLHALQTWLTVGEGEFGITSKTDPFTGALNTAIVVGGDVVKLMARLHGQCEIHAFVEGPHRVWLADMIAHGRQTHLLRADQGWEAVCELLRGRADTPVVTSYSVCHSFPNASIANWQDDCEGEDFWKLANSERWARALDGLRASGRGLELTPDDWDDFHFGNGVSGFQILEELVGRRIPPGGQP